MMSIPCRFLALAVTAVLSFTACRDGDASRADSTSRAAPSTTSSDTSAPTASSPEPQPSAQSPEPETTEPETSTPEIAEPEISTAPIPTAAIPPIPTVQIPSPDIPAPEVPDPVFPVVEFPVVSVPEVTDPSVTVQSDDTTTIYTVGADVLFDFDQSTLRADAVAALDEIAEVLRDLEPGVRITVNGHTDSIGTVEYNLGLSERRAISVVTHLVEAHGFDPARFELVAYGESRPAAPNTFPDGSDDPAGRQLNRRVEIVHGS